ncbi:4-hydroxythreonine-4-phosphate dehydrogenase PdxA [Thalassospira xiamenensis]|uniref:4-hydroxythreonine-4-phosphate dehydrogenase n=1 Tax=Thalassospira xiamenensis TaxID=220697 RepID=A0A367XC24_9PROT|nr:4-hydroxythreonine-4-phosphate dehydrogenase PdxA [Thalassospira xiamenensis]KZB54685.1 4-hydroxythreonine-4-phosphate dehydrogenase [Thalassospira xiamenensis]RCK50989.1 4-hydroxythreonine-4-phosphate dehydrogenase [Thalassospira xiamenensis]
MSDIKPIAMTLGEPGSIGPELAIKAWLARADHNLPPFFILSPKTIMDQTIESLGLRVKTKVIDEASQTGQFFEDALPVLEIPGNAEDIKPGTASSKTASVVIDSITHAVNLTRSGAASAVVTNPIQKSALYQAGFKHPGHTEFLAELSGSDAVPVMMLANSKLRVVPMTIHIALSEVPKQLTGEMIKQLVRITAASMQRDFGLKKPRLAIAGLNPHAGEDGSMGDEEIKVMRPAIMALRDEGFDVVGPLPADTMFHAEARANYDVALCPYHDQALIPVKTLDFHGGVNVTLGLPFIRTSPDHGTALDIAGKGIARPDSLIAAIKMAAAMARKRAAGKATSQGA